MKHIKVLSILLLLTILTACNNSEEQQKEAESNQKKQEISKEEQQEEVDKMKKEFEKQIDKDFDQFAKPTEKDTVVQMTVEKFGSIKIKLFPQYTPKTVENFVTHAKNKYYDGLTFHRVMNDFMIQGGDPKGDGTGGESIWKKPFEDEFNPNLFPYRGALCMANTSAPNTNGSQFFIVQLDKIDDKLLPDIEKGFPETIVERYKEHKGTPWLFYRHTVFGQVVEGIEIVDKIAKVETDPNNNKPKEDVIIKNIEIISESK